VIPHALKRRIAAWALRHLEPELGEWRTCRGTHWQLRSINLSLSMHEGSSLEMGYVQPVDFIQPADFIPFISWPDINVAADETIPDMFIPGDWRVPD
jgi:hypothetical protein